MSYRGFIAEIPVGQRGLTGNVNVVNISPDFLLRAENVTYEAGTVQGEGGASKYNSSAITGAPSVLGGHDWNHDGGTQRMVVMTSGGKLLKDSGGGTFATELATGLNATDSAGDPVVPVFAEGGKEAAANNRKLFIFTGRNAVQVLSADGATTAAIATPPADWTGTSQPKFGLSHEGRMWGGGNSNDPHRLYYSTTGTHEDFTGAGSGSIALFPGEGEGLVHAVSFRGGIVAFKRPRGIYFVDTSDTTVANWRVTKISDKIGAAWTGCVSPAQDDIAYVDQTGEIRLVTATDQFGDVRTGSLSDIAWMGQFVRDNLNAGQIKKWRLVYYSTKRELHLACTGTGATTNNGRLVVDFNRPDLPRFRFSGRDTAVSLWTRLVNQVPELTLGDNAGFVWRLDQEARSKAGSGYTKEFQIPHLDMSHLDPRLGTLRKNGQFLELVVEPKGNWNVAAQIRWDGQTHQTVQFNMGTTGAALGSFVLGTNALAEEQVLNKRRRITGSGRRFGAVFTNTGDSQDFSIARLYLHFTASDERLES